MAITLDTTLVRVADILYAPVGTEEGVMLSVQQGCYYGLNAVASRIWELLEAPKTIEQLSAHICDEFDVDAPTAEAEVLKFAAVLIEKGVVDDAAA